MKQIEEQEFKMGKYTTPFNEKHVMGRKNVAVANELLIARKIHALQARHVIASKHLNHALGRQAKLRYVHQNTGM